MSGGRLLVRAHKNPARTADAQTTLRRNLIGNNAGNLVFSHAVCRLLSVADVDITTVRLPPRTSFTAERINAEFDRLVLPLANAFRAGFLDNLRTLTSLVEGLTIPVTVLGVGAQAALDGSDTQPAQVHAQVARFVAAVLDRSPSIGVRGEFTRDYLCGLGFDSEQVRVIGCPSMFWHGPDLGVSPTVQRLEPESRIALNVSPYVDQMGPVTAGNTERYRNLVYVAQDLATLELLVRGQYRGAGRAAGLPISLEHPLFAEDRVRFFLDPTTWLHELRSYDFSFGSRIHGNIAALLAGTPAVVLAHDSRTLELARYHQIPYRPITGIGPDTDAADLYAEADWKPMTASHPDRFATFAGFLADHGLRHVYETGESPEAFDAGVHGAGFPPAVRTLQALSPDELYAIKRTADDHVRLERELRRHKRELRQLKRSLRREKKARRRTEARLRQATAPPPSRRTRLRRALRRRIRRRRPR